MRLRASVAVAALAVSCGALLIASGAVAGAAAASAKQIVMNSIAASKTASSVRVVGSVISGSQTIGLSVSASDANQGHGTITINGGVVKIVRHGASVYFNANATFWSQSGGAAAAGFAGQWVSTSATGTDGKSFSEFLGSAALFKQIFSGSNVSESTFVLEHNTIVSGVRVYAITATNTTDGTTGVVYIARTGKPYIVELTKTEKTDSSKLVFSAYNQPVHAKVPPHSITLKKLEQEAAANAAAG